jgi:hypothetical protein
MRQWPYYANVYFKYTHGSFNIVMKFIINFKKIDNINFVKITIVDSKNQNWYQEINVPYFWNNYTICIIILDPKLPKGGHYSVFSPFKTWIKLFINIFSNLNVPMFGFI